MTDFPAIYYYVLFTLWGVCLGSFFNVLIYRMPREMSLIRPASHCPRCNTKISPVHNIPIFSWFILGGKCAHCKEPISLQYPLVEFLGAALGFLGAFSIAPNAWIPANFAQMLCNFWLFTTLIPIFAIDFKYLLIPDTVSIGGIVLGFACSFFNGLGYLSSIIGILSCGGVLFLISLVSAKILGREGMGLGDVKLFAGFGAIMGAELSFLALVLGSLFAIIFIVPFRLITHRSIQEPLPFGPFLGVAAPVSYLLGDSINLIIGW